MLRVTALILAAGLSSRAAPRNKLLAALPGGEPLVARTARRTLASRVDQVLVVTGHQAELVEAALAGVAVRLVRAADYAAGLSASLGAGMRAIPADTQAVLVVLGDMPLVEPELIDALIQAYDPAPRRGIVVPVWDGQRGNPRLWGERHFGALRSLTGDAGAGRLLASHADDVVEVPAPSRAVLQDFDTPDALDAL